MAKYEVRIYETLMHTAEVEAEDRSHAIELAFDVIMNETGEYESESCGTSTEVDVMEITNA